MRKPKIPKLYGRKPFSKSAYGTDWSSTTKSIKERDGGRCVRCGSTNKVQTHHIIPLSKGGTNHSFNLITLCESCHESQHKHLAKTNKKKRSAL